MKAKEVEITHPDKLLFPDAGISKQDLADYYERIADRLLPHIEGRPLTLRCFPNGIEEDGFFNKNAPDHFPDFIERITVPTRDRDKEPAQMSSADEAADLVYFAGQNAIEIHAALSRVENLDTPDQIIFDLDPSDDDFSKVRRVACCFDDLLASLDIPVFWKTTGSRGLHGHVPLRPENDFETVRAWAKQLAERLQDEAPGLTTMEQRKDKRGDKVFIDYLRNAYGQTSIVPYGVRALEGATVSVPIHEDELEDSSLRPDRYTIKNVFQRLGQIEDPWKSFHRRRLKSLAEISN
ncbi:MAG TPA: non-homologous end-joining DNA ligase [Opitutales bacterium]|nr:non-homologous end-joining DNA ligase [Opitutales bacterium]